MQLVHLVTYNDKFIPAQLHFLNDEFGRERQKFYLLGGGAQIQTVLGGNVTRLSGRKLWRFLVDLHRSDRLVFNGLYSHAIIVSFLFFPWLLRKAVWLPWGGDLYWPELVPETRWNRFVDYLRGVFFRKLEAIATPTYGDYLKAVSLYRVKARYVQGCPNIFSFDSAELDSVSKMTGARRMTRPATIIQVGNSADPSNVHLEVFEWLRRFADENIEIHVPLSYGYQGVECYRDGVLRRGSELFGTKFKPILNLMDASAYNHYLASVDVMVFNHRRQQGFGNMVLSLYMGTKMYLRSEVSTWKLLSEEMGCSIFDACEIDHISFEQFVDLGASVRQKNKQAVVHLFDRVWQRQMWEKLYRD